MSISTTTCFEKIAKMNKEIRVVQGGTSAGKTYSILLYLIILGSKPNRNLLISIVAESVPVLKRGAYKDFLDIVNKMGLYKEENHNKTDRTYKIEDTTFEFFGADEPSKLRGARRDILFVNECNNISFEAFNELHVRTKKFSLLDYNPTAPFWCTTELVGQVNVDFEIVTYKDNEFLEDKIVKEIESWEEKGKTSQYYANRWRVMGQGLIGKQDGAIISDWSEIDLLPSEAELIGSGLDFGFTNDPTTLISVYRYNDEIIVDEKIYQKGLLNSNLAKLIKSANVNHGVIYADSASPQNIAELKAYGLNVLPVVKVKDSINYGLSLIQEKSLKITSDSANLIKELQNYVWEKDKDGNALNVPIDDWNHGIDALRYLFLMKFGNKGGFFSLKWRR